MLPLTPAGVQPGVEVKIGGTRGSYCPPFFFDIVSTGRVDRKVSQKMKRERGRVGARVRERGIERERGRTKEC